MTMPEIFKGLLDVNVLVAHAVSNHEHHQKVVHWHRRLPRKALLYSCPITELGLVRNIMRIADLSVAEARSLLMNERENLGLTLLPDQLGSEALPDWIQGYRQTTDGYLQTLAESYGARLVTLDKHIPGCISIFA